MIANAYLPSTEHWSQTNHQKKLFPHFQQQLSIWVDLYQRYLFCFCFDSENHFQWLANSTFFAQQYPFDPKCYANTISEILSQCLEQTLAQSVIWAARLMAWESCHYWGWVEEFAIGIIELREDDQIAPLPEAICQALLRQTIGLHSEQHASDWFEHFHGESSKPKRWTESLRGVGVDWYYPDYMEESRDLPDGMAYIERLRSSEPKL